MPFDALTLAAVADELRDSIVGGRIQGVFLPAPLAIGLEVHAHRQTRYLFASAHPQHARVHLTLGKIGRGTEDVTPLLLLLRKYVRDGRIAAVEQPPLERTVALIITKAALVDKRHTAGVVRREGGQRSPHLNSAPAHQGKLSTGRAQEGEPPQERAPVQLSHVRLIIEVMGRYSNIILVDEKGIVLEAVKHIPAEVNRYRVTLPHHPYVPPPPQAKADPRGLTEATLAPLLAAAAKEPAWQVLLRTYRGISPLLAREAVFRAVGQTDALAADVPAARLASALSSLLSAPYTHRWSPTLAQEGDTILEYAPYELTQFGRRCIPAAGISAAIHAYYAQETIAAEYTGLRQSVQKALAQERERVLRRKEALEKQQAAAAAEHLRLQGELLLAYPLQVTPGQTEAVIETTPGEAPQCIPLDPRLSVVENAQQYFKRYAQARDAARSLPPLLEEAAFDLAFLDQLQLDLEMAKTAEDIAQVRRVLAKRGETKQEGKRKQQPRKQPAGSAPITIAAEDGVQIIVGRNAAQNDYITFELASPDDLWLHARGVAGSHVIVCRRGRAVSQATLQQAAALAAAHSAARSSTQVAVDYTPRRCVRRAKGGKPGMVTYINEKTIHVRPADAVP